MKPTRAEKQRQNKGEKEEEKGRAIKNQGKEKREYICYFNSLTNISCVTSWHFILLEFG
jgi:hypothetical protein